MKNLENCLHSFNIHGLSHMGPSMNNLSQSKPVELCDIGSKQKKNYALCQRNRYLEIQQTEKLNLRWETSIGYESIQVYATLSRVSFCWSKYAWDEIFSPILLYQKNSYRGIFERSNIIDRRDRETGGKRSATKDKWKETIEEKSG